MTSTHGQTPWYRPEFAAGRRFALVLSRVSEPTPGGVRSDGRRRCHRVATPWEGGAVPQSDDERLVDLSARLEHKDPRLARPLSAGRPARPREYRRRSAWGLLAMGV